MSESLPPPSSQMPPPGGGGSSMYILAVMLLLGAIAGLLYWKLGGSPAQPIAAPAKSAVPSAPTATVILDPPPPPPPMEDLPGVADASAPRAAGAGASQCASVTCSGMASSDLRRSLSQRAASARGCYERALRGNASLQGQVTVAVRVDSTGNVCSANLAQDQIHSSEVSSCLLGMFRSGKFPPASGGCVDVNVPMSFVPQESK